MNIPLISSLDLQLAARDEYYSDFGNVLKPKVAGFLKVMDGLRFRSSWSQSFRAPNLAQYYSAGTQVANTRTDWAQCRINVTTCSGISTLEVRSGNQQLKPEDAETISWGAVFQPLRNLTLTVDRWSLKSTGVIGLQGAQNQILFDYLERQSGRSNPNVVRLAPVGAQRVGDISFVQDDYFNLGPRKLRGIDIALSYDSGKTDLGRFSFDLGASKLLKWLQTPSELQAQLIAANAAGTLGTGINITQAGDQVKQNGNPEWRFSGSVTWKSGPVTAGAQLDYIGSIFDTGTSVVNGNFYEAPAFTTMNAYIQFQGREQDKLLQGMRFRVGARNLFDRDPPLTSSNFGFNGAIANPTGRFVYFEASRDF
jgi:outer membrane receptor protein involved in Fe transport